ncbi:MAG: hypothetical protein PHI36_01180 [Bacteroidales bacterium]|nr:hypothetical protein [Bacteroidales bacterium]
MKKLLIPILIFFTVLGCGKDNNFDGRRAVVSDSEKIPFEELLLLINLKTSDSSYLVIPSIDSVNLFVNNFYWSTKNSVVLDTSNIEKYALNNMFHTSNKLNYLVLAKKADLQTNFNTAGEYAHYLNSLYQLKPGEYACLINSFQILLNDNTIKTYHPITYKTFKVEGNSYSAFVGEIEIKLY